MLEFSTFLGPSGGHFGHREPLGTARKLFTVSLFIGLWSYPGLAEMGYAGCMKNKRRKAIRTRAASATRRLAAGFLKLATDAERAALARESRSSSRELARDLDAEVMNCGWLASELKGEFLVTAAAFADEWAAVCIKCQHIVRGANRAGDDRIYGMALSLSSRALMELTNRGELWRVKEHPAQSLHEEGSR